MITNSLGMASGASPFLSSCLLHFSWSLLLLSLSSHIFTRAILCLIFFCSLHRANPYGSLNTEQLIPIYTSLSAPVSCLLNLSASLLHLSLSALASSLSALASSLSALLAIQTTSTWATESAFVFRERSDGWTPDYTTSGGFQICYVNFWERLDGQMHEHYHSLGATQAHPN